MSKQLSSATNKVFFRLPLEPNSVKLTLKTLNIYSEFRRPKKPYLRINVRKIYFRKEVLTIGVKLDDEMEERVFIHVTEKELLVSCTVDTDETYLSRYAYFGLLEMMSIYDYYNFEKFYWPNFFERNTGKSKYLNIINDRKGMDVTIKAKYPYFYKPGHQLITPSLPAPFPSRSINAVSESFIDTLSDHAIGYCLADTNLHSLHSNHFPFLVPYLGELTKSKDSVKKYITFLTKPGEIPYLQFTTAQKQLNDICFKMMELAPVKSIFYQATEEEAEEITNNNATRKKVLFTLWQSCISLLHCQIHQSYYFTYGISNVKGKPRKKDLDYCKFSLEVPKLCFLLADKDDYYQLELRFKAQGKTFIPYEFNTAFFISSKTDPLTFYLLSSFADYEVTSFFARHKFKIAVLKDHYKNEFKDFVDRLGQIYEIK